MTVEHSESDNDRLEVIETVLQAMEYLRSHHCFPNKDLSKKGGVGIYRCFFHHVGLQVINRILARV